MDHASGPTKDPRPLDPENDIDAKSAAKWVIGGTGFLFVSLWLLVPIFIQVQDYEIRRKVNEAPNTELKDIMATERSFLYPAGEDKKSIDKIVASKRPSKPR